MNSMLKTNKVYNGNALGRNVKETLRKSYNINY